MSIHHEEPCYVPLFAGAETVCRSAALWREMTAYYERGKLTGPLARLHTLSTAARKTEQQLAEQLIHAFLPPMDREDLALIMRRLTAIPTAIETAARTLAAVSPASLRPELSDWASLLEESGAECRRLMTELPQALKEKASGQADRMLSLYHKHDLLMERALRRLHTGPDGQTAVWQLLFLRMEDCCRSCLRLAETTEWVILKSN